MKFHSLVYLSLTVGNAIALSQNSTRGILVKDGVNLGDWEQAYEKASKLVSKLTTAQKLSLITGGSVNTSTGSFSALKVQDGSMGVEDYYYVSAFSQTSALGMTWDKDAIYEQSKAIATEFYLKGIQLINGPTSQPLGRTAWGGRMGEVYGPDAYLNGIAFGRSVKAYVDVGIIPNGKHFLLNEQETNRTALFSNNGGADGPPYSSNADDKTIHEAYLWPFYDGVKNGLGAVMCAMTSVNGSRSCENADLLLGLLKTELGFPGMVYPDVSAQNSAVDSATGGLDYGSSSIWSTSVMNQLLSNGTLTQGRLTDMAIRNVIGYYYVNLDNGTQPSYVEADAYVDVRANHSQLIRANGAKSIVLLKNINNALPLNKPHLMSVFGSNARPVIAGPNYALNVQGSGPTYDGHLATGTGSGTGSLPYSISPYEALSSKAKQDGTMLFWVMNDTYTSSQQHSVGAGGTGTEVSAGIETYAANTDTCLVFINALAGEGADRTELYNADQDTLVKTVADNCNSTVVVINTVGPRLVDQWIEHENVTAVLYASLLGQESGNSIIDVLYGDVNPSARLTYTIAKNESDYNVGICYTKQCNFTEGVYIDYRYFDAYNVTPRYPFGHGLSYTTFSYSDLTIDPPPSLSVYPTGTLTVGGYEDLWDIVANVSITLQNTGSIDGAEVPQLYLSYPAAANQPVRQLRGFERVEITAGSSTEVRFELRRRDLSYWDVTAQKWAVSAGKYTIAVGASSRDIKLTGTFTVETTSD